MAPFNFSDALEKKLAELETAIEAGKPQEELLKIYHQIKELQFQKTQSNYFKQFNKRGNQQ
jgi:hypothetical protein